MASLMLNACTQNHPEDLTAGKGSERLSLDTCTIGKNSLASVVKLPGELKPFESVDIYPKVNGFIKEMFVDRGSEVQKGDIMMTLEAPEIDQQFQASQAKLLQAQENINASRDLYFRLRNANLVPGSVSELDLNTAEAKYQADSALVSSEQANLKAIGTLRDYLTVRAPFNGIVKERNIHPGALTGPNFKLENKPLLILENNTLLRLEVFIPEAYAGSLDNKDNEVSFTSQALNGQLFHAPVKRTSHSIYDSYRSEALEADVQNTDGIFKPGMYVETSLKIKSPVTAFVAPVSSIVTTTEGKYLVVVEGGRAKFVTIREGISDKGFSEVFGNLNGNEVLLKNPTPEIKEGMEIK